MGENDRELKRNASGYYDPTAYTVLKKMDDEEERFHKLLHHIFYICECAGFHVEERIVIRDKRTGRVWK